MNKRILLLILSICLITHTVSAQQQWKGSAAMGRYGEFPMNGLYAASNAFPRNTFIEVRNTKNGRTVKVIVVDRLRDPGLFILLSRDAAIALGMSDTEIINVEAVIPPSDRAALSYMPVEKAYSPDPDINPAAEVGDPDAKIVLTEELFPEEDIELPEAVLATAEEAEEAEEEIETAAAEADDEFSESDAEYMALYTEPVIEAAAVSAEEETVETVYVEEAAEETALAEEPEAVEEVIAAAAPEVLEETAIAEETESAEEIALTEEPEALEEITLAGEPVITEELYTAEAEEEPAEVYTDEIAEEPAAVVEEEPAVAAEIEEEELEYVLEAAEPKPPVEVTAETVIAAAEETAEKTPAEEAVIELKADKTEVTAVKEEAVKPLPAEVIETAAVVKPVLEGKANYFIQLGAFTDRAGAVKLQSVLPKNPPAFIIQESSGAKTVYKVVVGPVTKDERGSLLNFYKTRGYKDAFLRQGE
jgi:hypothetical protein